MQVFQGKELRYHRIFTLHYARIMVIVRVHKNGEREARETVRGLLQLERLDS